MSKRSVKPSLPEGTAPGASGKSARTDRTHDSTQPQPAPDGAVSGNAPAAAGADAPTTQSRSISANPFQLEDSADDSTQYQFVTFDPSHKHLARVVEVKGDKVTVRRFDKKAGEWRTCKMTMASRCISIPTCCEIPSPCGASTMTFLPRMWRHYWDTRISRLLNRTIRRAYGVALKSWQTESKQRTHKDEHEQNPRALERSSALSRTAFPVISLRSERSPALVGLVSTQALRTSLRARLDVLDPKALPTVFSNRRMSLGKSLGGG
jgi:hypothetical protein